MKAILTRAYSCAPEGHTVLKFNAATNGNIFVRPTFGENLRELHDVRISNPQDGQVLKYNGAGGYWYNAAP